jgi:hypothetical protein
LVLAEWETGVQIWTGPLTCPRKWTCQFHKRKIISWQAQRLPVSELTCFHLRFPRAFHVCKSNCISLLNFISSRDQGHDENWQRDMRVPQGIFCLLRPPQD